MGTMWWTPTTSQPKAMAARVHMAPLAQLLPMAATPPRPMAPQPVAQMEEGLHFLSGGAIPKIVLKPSHVFTWPPMQDHNFKHNHLLV